MKHDINQLKKFTNYRISIIQQFEYHLFIEKVFQGKGQPLFNVRDIAAQSRIMATNASNHTSENLYLNKTPKRKTDEDREDSPTKKCKE